MSKRTVLSLLMLLVGSLSSLSIEGLLIGLPLLILGGYWLVESRLPRSRLRRIPSRI